MTGTMTITAREKEKTNIKIKTSIKTKMRTKVNQTTNTIKYFTEDKRMVINNYYAGQYKHGKNCPPGLAKKHNGCMPPGQAKKWAVGRPLPPDVVYYCRPAHSRRTVRTAAAPPQICPCRAGYSSAGSRNRYGRRRNR